MTKDIKKMAEVIVTMSRIVGQHPDKNERKIGLTVLELTTIEMIKVFKTENHNFNSSKFCQYINDRTTDLYLIY